MSEADMSSWRAHQARRIAPLHEFEPNAPYPHRRSFREPCMRVSFGPPMNARRAMSAIGLRRLGLIMAFLLQAALLKAALPGNPDETPSPPSLIGRLLVAAPSMDDP